jgi:ParB-like chromosome segregation protein Spo0J
MLFELEKAGLKIADGQQTMLEAREIKSIDEIALLNRAAAMVDGAYHLVHEQLKPGVRENDIVAEVNKFLYTHEEVARKLGKSRSGITEILSLTQIPEEVIEYCQEYGINSRSHLLAIAHQRDTEGMLALAEQIRTQNLTREDVRNLRKPKTDERSSVMAQTTARPAGVQTVRTKTRCRVGRGHSGSPGLRPAPSRPTRRPGPDRTRCRSTRRSRNRRSLRRPGTRIARS